MRPPPSVQRLAEAQLGLIARRQIVASQGEGAARSLLRSGWTEAVEFGVHRVLGGARLPIQRALAATLRAGPGATLTGPAALALLDLDGFGVVNADHPFEVLLPFGRRLNGVGFPTRRDPDPARAVTSRGEIRIVAPVDALIDSAPFAPEIGARRIRLAHDVLRWRGLIRPGRLNERICELGRRAPGGMAIAELLDLDRQDGTGDGERRLGALLERFDPAPLAQHWVTPRRRVDWWFPALRHAIEYQGKVDHGTAPGRADDRERDAQLRRENIHLTYVTEVDLRDEATLIASLSAALAARAYHLGVAAPQLRAS